MCHGNTAHTTTSVTESPRLFAMVTAKHRAFIVGNPPWPPYRTFGGKYLTIQPAASLCPCPHTLCPLRPPAAPGAGRRVEWSGVEWTPHPSPGPGPSTEESPSRGSRHQLMVPRRGREDEGCGAGARATTTYVKYKYWPSPAQIVDI